ncbi:MAG: ABC transporter ATP-binding protein [Conexivisphaerales archaeon]
MTEILVLEKVAKKYGKVIALDVERLGIEEGTYNVILGPSGAGKSTMLRIVAGLDYPDSGKIILGGKDITNKPAWERDIGLVFQNYALYPHFTIYDNIALPLTVKGLKKEEIRERVMQIVKVMGIEEHINKYPRQLSGGQQQRVALARAVIKQPKLLLLDEPLSNLDAKVRIELRSYLKSLQRQLNITALHVTHDQSEAMAIADNLVVLNGGAVDQVGSPREIYENPKTVFVSTFIGMLNVVPTVVFSIKDGYDSIGFRPENAEIVENPEPGAIEGTVKYVEYQGEETIVYLAVNDNSVRIRDRQDRTFEPGKKVYVKVNRAFAFKDGKVVKTVQL